MWLKRKTMLMEAINVHIVAGMATVPAGKKEKLNALPSTNLVINAENKAIFAQSVDPISKSNRDHLMKLKIATMATVIRLVL